MRVKYFFFTFVWVYFVLNVGTAQQYTISGFLSDAESGEALIGASVFVTNFDRGTATNSYGFFSVTLPQSDSIAIVFSYIGYEPEIKTMFLHENERIDVRLAPVSVALEQVVVSASEEQGDRNVNSLHIGQVNIPLSKIKELPGIMGEADVLKVIQLLPGVQSGNEGTTGFFVRGGNLDQNLVQLDEAILYNPNHLLGIFSTFNSRALNKATLIKGGFPAQFGGRLSSILDIQMKEGNDKKFGVDGGIGLVTSQLSVEGPIKKELASFIISGRRTYLDLIARPFLPKGNGSNYHFYDLNAKVNWKITPKDRVFISGFKGQDDAAYLEAQGLKYNIKFGNTTATLRWNHLFGSKLFSNVSLIYNEYKQNIYASQDNSFSNASSNIEDLSGKAEFQYFPNPKHTIRFGTHFTNHKFLSFGETGGLSSGNPGGSPEIRTPTSEFYNEAAIYINDEWLIHPRFSTSLGLRGAGFFAKNASYFRVEPRVNLKFKLSKTSSIKAAYTVMNQFLHLIPSSTASIPTDIWIPSTEQTKPQFSQQYALGYFENFAKNKYEASLEIYYKTMGNQVLFKEGNQLIANLDVDEFLTYGKGWSYGAEFFLRKNTGKLTGWLSYTLSKTEQQFQELNFGERFPFKYDRRNVLNIVANYKLSKRWSMSGVFVYTSGNVFTLPSGRIAVAQGGSLFEGNYFVYEGRNNVRLGSYHRLDITFINKKKASLFKKKFDRELIFGFYNIYSRQNPYFVHFLVDPASNEPKAKQVSLLPIIPGFSYNFRF